MYNIPPIPKNLLCDTVTIKSYKNHRGKTEYAEDEVIELVRVQYDRKLNFADGNNIITEGNILFVDVANSVYSDIGIFTNESIVIYKNKELKIKDVEEVYGENELHHLEITLL